MPRCLNLPKSSAAQHVARMRSLRVRPERDNSLGFLAEQFKREVARPFKQLGDLTELWRSLLPEKLADGTRLESLQRGVLTVAVDSSARLYEVDRLLRDGLQSQLIQQHHRPGDAPHQAPRRHQSIGWRGA